MPPGGTATALAPHFVQRAVEGLRYIISGVTPATWFGPLQPLPPQAPPDVGGRQFDYPVGYNLAIAPRSDEPISFAQLRALADGYDLLRTVIETRKDQVERLRWSIRRADLSDAKPRNRDDDPRIAAIEAFLRMPDRVHFWSTWLRQLLEDLFVADAPTLYLRRNRGGQLHALEIVDGTTIKRLIDADGRTPEPPDPAYQQVLHGLPAADFTTRELIYRPRNPRPHKLYGYSPVEQIVMTVNIALRRQLHQLAYYTEGNVPEALIGTPESWTPPQIKEFQQYWDALLEGNLAQRRHAKFVPGGVAKTFIPTRDAELKGAFDEWLARIVCFAFSISPQGFLAQMNRATAETAQQAALAEGLAPIQTWVKQLIDYVLITEFDAPDLEFCWRDEREVDAQKAASVAQIYVNNAIKTVNEARSDLGLDPVAGGDVALVFTGSGPVPLAKVGEGQVPNAAPVQRAADGSPLAKYSPDQPRDERGRWSSDGGPAEPNALQYAEMEPSMRSDASEGRSGADTSSASKGKINWQKIGELEGNKLDGYVPAKNGAPLGSSGVTVGMGVDLGQMDQKSLDALDISQSVKDKLKPYLGLKGTNAQTKLKSNPLSLSQDEVDKLNAAVQEKQVKPLRENYDAVVGPNGTKFDDLPEQAQTVIASVTFQNGKIWASNHKNADVKKFWKAATDKDWVKMQSMLRNWALKDYKTRRNKEADYLDPIVSKDKEQPAAPAGKSMPGSRVG